MQRREHDRDRVVGSGVNVEDDFPAHESVFPSTVVAWRTEPIVKTILIMPDNLRIGFARRPIISALDALLDGLVAG
jgi:hypothetical protein